MLLPGVLPAFTMVCQNRTLETSADFQAATGPRGASPPPGKSQGSDFGSGHGVLGQATGFGTRF